MSNYLPNNPNPWGSNDPARKRPNWVMRHKVATGVGAVVLLAGVGTAVGTGTDTTQEPAPVAQEATQAPTTQAPTPKKAKSVDDVFLDYLDGQGIYYSTPKAAVEMGHLICGAFDDGATFRQVGITLLSADTGYTPEQLGQWIGASVGAYCPQFSDVVDGGRPA
ncbi:DUF732 domain-containing protein [Tomitella gaofuii]|uniref:DUF732 domain-containing protein n=1 Tax=Tomitella gaofuii TaxID=2760083 RepID=UPI0015FD9420|nr:DUF732 domain-containing protein [Tomitella gaofuii]